MNAKSATTAALVAAALLAPAQAFADTSATGSVGGLIWFDRDSSGTVTLGDGTADIWPALDATNLATGVTERTFSYDSTGRYSLPDMAPGRYRVEVVTGWNYQRTTPGSVEVTVRAGKAATVDFGLRGAKICGTVWDDTDRDGMRDNNEWGVGGVRITLNTPYLGTEYSTASGRYCANDLPPVGNGRVEVTDVDRLGYGFTPNGIVEADPAEPFDSKVDPTTGRSHFHPLAGPTDQVVDIGLVKKPA